MSAGPAAGSPWRVLHLVGSAESPLLDDLSRLYARDCLTELGDPACHTPLLAHVSPDGRWRFPESLDDDAIAAAAPLGAAAAIDQLAELEPDLALPQMFCHPGMTRYRALLETLGIPYIGNPPETMAIGADKAWARAIVAAAGVAVPPGETCGPGERPTIDPPAVVKPVDGDNSLGLTLVRDVAGYPAAVDLACAHSRAALVERYVPAGREVRCGIVERDGELVTLPLEEYAVDPVDKPIRDGADKLARTADGELGLVAKDAEHAWIVDPDDPVAAAVGAAARRAHRALGCRHYSLFDFRIDPAGRPWFLEAGLYCSFARQSVITTMARAAGIATAELFSSLAAAVRHPPVSRKAP